MLGNNVNLLLEWMDFRPLRQSPHNFLMAHKRIRAEMHQFTFAKIGLRIKFHLCAFTAIRIHQSQFFQRWKLQIRMITQDTAQRVRFFIARTHNGGVGHRADAEAVQHYDNKSFTHPLHPRVQASLASWMLSARILNTVSAPERFGLMRIIVSPYRGSDFRNVPDTR